MKTEHCPVDQASQKYWSRRLCDQYHRRPKRKRAVRLPAAEKMRVTGEGDKVTIHLPRSAVAANMQENSSAFEGWSLALHHWCGVDVTLQWQQPRIPDPDAESDLKVKDRNERHYQRFLYRVKCFKMPV